MRKTKIKKSLLFWILPVMWMGILFYFSSKPCMPHVTVLNLDKCSWNDKLFHFGAYFILAGLLFKPVEIKQKLPKSIIIMSFCFLYGLFDEIHQLYIPGRSFSLIDLAADVIGSLVCIIILTTIYGGIKNVRRKESTT